MLWNDIEIPDKPYYQNANTLIYHAGNGEILSGIKGIASAIVTDPPYELGFMGKAWDSKGISFQPETWRIIRESCKPGAMLLSFGGSRTFHRIACAIEDAGWQIRDTICWVYGSGFPKSLDISKAIDKQAGIWRGKRGNVISENRSMTAPNYERTDKENPITPEAQLWSGWGTALKPAYEPIILAMNPLDGTFANNALKHGVAGLNIDECRIPCEKLTFVRPARNPNTDIKAPQTNRKDTPFYYENTKGRFPANFIHDGSQEVMELFPDSKTGEIKPYISKDNGMFGIMKGKLHINSHQASNGSAARFFYCAKASRAERDAGLEDMPLQQVNKMGSFGNQSDFDCPDGAHRIGDKGSAQLRNNHPTVKPLTLMEYLVKLVKMPGYNLIIDPFCGSGTTLLACQKLGIPCIGIDNDEKSCEIAAKRSNSQNMI